MWKIFDARGREVGRFVLDVERYLAGECSDQNYTDNVLRTANVRPTRDGGWIQYDGSPLFIGWDVVYVDPDICKANQAALKATEEWLQDRDTDSRYVRLARRLGALVESKQRQYGDSVGKTGDIMRILYPDGIRPDQVDDALLVVRVLDKLSRISQRGADGADLGGESPWMDIAGYGLLGWSGDGDE